MKITIIACNRRTPHWVQQATRDYQKRFPAIINLRFIDVTSSRRHSHQALDKLIKQEGERMLSHIPSQDRVIALDQSGKMLSSLDVAQQVQHWLHQQQNISFLIGGPDGLSPQCLDIADHRWSLSAMTLPHHIVKIFLIEQLYRAWSINNKHPYHR